MARPIRWRPGGLRSLAAAGSRYQHRLTAPERTPSREPASNWPVRFGGGLERCGPSQPAVRRHQHPFHGADGADALQGTGQQLARPIRWRRGGLRSLAAAGSRYQHRLTAPTERAPSREPASNGPSDSVEAWRAAVPRSRRFADINTRFTAPTERAPSREPASNGPSDRCRPGGLRSLAAAVRRHQHRFTAPMERTPSREPASNEGPVLTSCN